MASPNPYTKRRSSPPSPPPSKPTGGGVGFFGKSVLFALFLLALPLFPSQAPDFIGETVFNKFWELIHLLFVGIAVAYGLFSRRNLESESELRTSRVVVDESSLSYVSRIFQVSSVFDNDDELDNSCDFVDVRSESGRDSEVVKERKSESFVVESELEEEVCEYGKVSEVRAWNSKYFQGRSKVVVARPAYGLDGHVVHQPLGLPVRSLRSGLRDNAALEDDGNVNEEAETLADEVMVDPSSPGRWHSGMGENYSVDETQFAAAVKSRSSSRSSVSSASSSSRTSFESHSQNRFSPSRSVSEESNVEEELVKEKSLEGSSRSSSPSLPPSPSLSLSPPLPELVTDGTHRRVSHSPPLPEIVTDATHRRVSHSPPLPELVTDADTYRRVSHSRHYSDGSLLEEDVRRGFENEMEGSKVRDRRAELFGKKERGSKSLNFTAESSRRGNKSRRSYPPEPVSSPTGGADDATASRRDIHQKSDGHLFEDHIGKGLESDLNNPRVKKGNKSRRSYPPESISSPVGDADNATTRRRDLQQKSDGSLFEDNIKKELESELNTPRVKKGRSHDSLELTAEDSPKDDRYSESFPALDVLFQPTNAKASRRAMRSSRGGRDTLPDKDVTRNSEEDSVDFDKSRKKNLRGNDTELKPNSPRCEPQSWRSSNKVPTRGKSVRTIRSDRHKTDGDSSDDRAVAKLESRGRTKSRRQQRHEELSIVLHQSKTSETRAISEPEDEPIEETVAEEPQVVALEEEEEEEEAAWESQSNASHDHNEVDRKAGEFIAKFREQIRLQKLTSGEQPRGGGGGPSIIRGGGPSIIRGGGPSIIRNSHFR
ncbi:hypothetical protein AALP_AA5G259500 [Arabis alpina]|uniref:Uncharacterized protein n=1 Tax=Arabis alpina TaxID=50452 RepID=A0A087GZE3_ARAAL|nr:hypothetical protein AALP_AA5G259500 [Arabis alpina]